jgi:signal transduction histidine kinase
LRSACVLSFSIAAFALSAAPALTEFLSLPPHVPFARIGARMELRTAPTRHGRVPARISRDWGSLLASVERAATRNRHRPDLRLLLNHVLRHVGEMLPVVWAAAWIFDEQEQEWSIVASLGLTPEALRLRFRSGSALPCRVGERGVPMLVNDLDKEEFYRTSEEHYRMRSALYAPMRIHKRTIGVLAVYSDRRGTYRERDLELLTAVGEHLGVAVAFALMEERATRIAILDERDRHARDLHDGIHQVLSSLRIYALEARKALRTRDTKEAISLLGELTSTIDEAADELRESIAMLRRHDDTLQTIYEVAPRMEHRLRAAGLDVALSLGHLELPRLTSDALAWICRESANNVLKHSNAKRVEITLQVEGGHAVLRVADDGVGFENSDLSTSSNGLRIGLEVMEERAFAVGGTLVVESARRKGTRVECRAPLAPSR